MSLSGSSLSRWISCAMTRLALASSTWQARNTIRPASSREYRSNDRSPRLVCSTTIGTRLDISASMVAPAPAATVPRGCSWRARFRCRRSRCQRSRNSVFGAGRGRYGRTIMRTLPLADPGTPDLRSPTRLLLWVARGQLGVLLAGMGFGVLWMGAQAVLPALVGRAIDEGVAGGDAGALLRWSGLIFAAGVGGAAAGILRHRVAVVSWLTATYRVQQLLVRQAVRLGGSLARRVATGELVGVGSQDAERVGAAMDITARLTGALVSFVVVAVLMLRTSPTLGLVVVVGVPLLSGALAPLLRPLHARRARHRELVGALTTLGADTVSGLRVLRGVGGEEEFSRRHAAASQEVRAAGVAAVRVLSLGPELPSGGTAAEPPPGSVLVDGPSGLVVRPGRLTAVVAGVPEEAAAIADRLGRFADPGADGADAGDAVTLGGVPLRDLPLEVVRRRVLVSEHDPRLFTRRVAGEVDPTRAAPPGRRLAAV